MKNKANKKLAGKQMLREYNMSSKYEEVEKWHDGYNIGNVELRGFKKI